MQNQEPAVSKPAYQHPVRSRRRPAAYSQPRKSVETASKEHPIDVVFFHRHPIPLAFSIERLFADVRKALPPRVECRVVLCPHVSRGFWPRLRNAIYAFFRQGQINHITGDVHYLACLLRKRGTLLSIMDCVALEHHRGLRWKVLYFFWYWLPSRRAALISVISESTKQQLLRYLNCPPEKIRVVHCPVSDDFQPAPKEFNASRPMILQVGTTENKNLCRIAEALRDIPCHLRIIGKLSDAQLRKLQEVEIDFSSVAGISVAEVVKEYQHCDMLVFASTYEGFGLPILEANATGRPVVTSNILSMPEVAGEAACLVDPFDVQSIRKGITRITEDSQYRNELIRVGYQNVERFRASSIASRYASLYEELLRSAS